MLGTQAIADRPRTEGDGLNNAGTTCRRSVEIGARPEPPSNTPMGRGSRFAGTTIMGFSFRGEEERPSPAGNSGSPVRDAPPRTAERLGSAPDGARRKKARGPCGAGPSLDATVSRRARRRLPAHAMPFDRGRRAGHRVQPVGRTEHSTICMAGPDRSRGFKRQVTTATPARLDFRASRPADEGCADTMSAEEPLQCSAVSGSLQGPPAWGGAPPAASAVFSGPLRVAVAEESGWDRVAPGLPSARVEAIFV